MSQPLFPSVWARHAAPAITPVVPFTYSDNVTYLHLLEELRDKIQELIKSYNEFQGTMQEWAEQFEAEVNKILDELYDKLKPELERELREYVEHLVDGYGDQAVARDATAGDHTVSCTDAVWHAFDDARYWAFYSGDWDALDRTAEEIDGLEETAKHYDLYATNGIFNVEYGDFQRSNA